MKNEVARKRKNKKKRYSVCARKIKTAIAIHLFVFIYQTALFFTTVKIFKLFYFIEDTSIFIKLPVWGNWKVHLGSII